MIELILAILLLMGCLYLLFRGFLKRVRNRFTKSTVENTSRLQVEDDDDLDNETRHKSSIEEELSFITNIKVPNPKNEHIKIHTKPQNKGLTSLLDGGDIK